MDSGRKSAVPLWYGRRVKLCQQELPAAWIKLKGHKNVTVLLKYCEIIIFLSGCWIYVCVWLLLYPLTGLTSCNFFSDFIFLFLFCRHWLYIRTVQDFYWVRFRPTAAENKHSFNFVITVQYLPELYCLQYILGQGRIKSNTQACVPGLQFACVPDEDRLYFRRWTAFFRPDLDHISPFH